MNFISIKLLKTNQKINCSKVQVDVSNWKGERVKGLRVHTERLMWYGSESWHCCNHINCRFASGSSCWVNLTFWSHFHFYLIGKFILRKQTRPKGSKPTTLLGSSWYRPCYVLLRVELTRYWPLLSLWMWLC